MDLKERITLQLLDTGLMNYFAGLQTEIFGTTDLNAIYGGKVVEHLVGQELYASQTSMLIATWKKGFNAAPRFPMEQNGLGRADNATIPKTP